MEKTIILSAIIFAAFFTIVYYVLLITKVYKREVIQFLLRILNGRREENVTKPESRDETGRTEIIIKSSYKTLSGQNRNYQNNDNDITNRVHQNLFKSYPGSDMDAKKEEERDIPVINLGEDGTMKIDVGGFTIDDLQNLEDAAQRRDKLSEAEKEKIADTIDKLKECDIYGQMLTQVSGFSELASNLLNENKENLLSRKNNNHKS